GPDTGVVDEYVKTAEAAVRHVDRPDPLGLFGNILLQGTGTSRMQCIDLGDPLLRTFDVDVGQEHLRSLASQEPGYGGAEPLGGACDECNLVLYPAHFVPYAFECGPSNGPPWQAIQTRKGVDRERAESQHRSVQTQCPRWWNGPRTSCGGDRFLKGRKLRYAAL